MNLSNFNTRENPVLFGFTTRLCFWQLLLISWRFFCVAKGSLANWELKFLLLKGSLTCGQKPGACMAGGEPDLLSRALGLLSEI